MKVKRLIPALAMLLIAAMLMGTSTFAWFSMNKEVTATNLKITAKADTTFLLIGQNADDTAAEIRAAAENINITLATGDSGRIEATLYPAELATASTNPSADTTAANWWYAEGQAKDNYAEKAGSRVVFSETKRSARGASELTVSEPEAPATTTTFQDRVLKKTVYICLAAGSDDAKNLRVKLTTMTDNIKASASGAALTRVVVATSTAAQYFTVANVGQANTTGTVLATTISGDTVIPVDIYVYFTGDAENVDTAHADYIVGKIADTIGLAFFVD